MGNNEQNEEIDSRAWTGLGFKLSPEQIETLLATKRILFPYSYSRDLVIWYASHSGFSEYYIDPLKDSWESILEWVTTMKMTHP